MLAILVTVKIFVRFFISAVAILYYLYFYPHTLDFTNLLTIQIINQYILFEHLL